MNDCNNDINCIWHVNVWKKEEKSLSFVIISLPRAYEIKEAPQLGSIMKILSTCVINVGLYKTIIALNTCRFTVTLCPDMTRLPNSLNSHKWICI